MSGRILATINCREVRLSAESTEVIQGILNVLILRALNLEPMHGLGAARPLED